MGRGCVLRRLELLAYRDQMKKARLQLGDLWFSCLHNLPPPSRWTEGAGGVGRRLSPLLASRI